MSGESRPFKPPLVSSILAASFYLGGYISSYYSASNQYKAKYLSALPTYTVDELYDLTTSLKTHQRQALHNLAIACEVVGKTSIPAQTHTPVTTRLSPVGQRVCASKYQEYKLCDTVYEKTKEKKEQGVVIQNAEYGVRRSEDLIRTIESGLDELYIIDRNASFPSDRNAPPSYESLSSYNIETSSAPASPVFVPCRHLILPTNNIPASLFQPHSSTSELTDQDTTVICTPEAAAGIVDKPRLVGFKKVESVIPLEKNISVIANIFHDGSSLRAGRLLDTMNSSVYEPIVSYQPKHQTVEALLDESQTLRYLSYSLYTCSAASVSYAIYSTLASLFRR